uniref:Mitochondrial inner membrane protease subunit n=1 Tax=Takifugu rubripes TaxID=31033 RepID=A0A674MF66_TAKRU
MELYNGSSHNMSDLSCSRCFGCFSLILPAAATRSRISVSGCQIIINMFRRTLGKTAAFVGYAIQYGCVAHCAFEYVGEVVVCSGPSMEPTIVSDDIIFSERVSRHCYNIKKGDVIIAKSPFDPSMNICKRVIGLEGDKVCTSGASDLFQTHTYVPLGHIWVEGDNRQNSSDSRSYGPIPYALIRGRACLKLWPPHRAGTLGGSPTRR